MSTTTQGLTVEDHNRYYTSAMGIANTRSKYEVKALGERIKLTIATPYDRSAERRNVLAQTLEDVRRVYMVRFAPAVAPTQPELPALQREINLGTFTVSYPEGDYYTVELERVEQGELAEKVIASFLRGPDNERDFQGFAFINQRDGHCEVQTWKKFRGIDERWKMAALIAADSTQADALGMAEAYAQRSGRCSRCGRKLTVPASLHRGYGPDCAALLGLA